MGAFEKFIVAISKTSVEPQMFGHVHLICLGIMLTLIVLLCVFAKNWQEKNVKKLLLAVWLIMVITEVYKQLVFSYNGTNDKWDFQWYAFPFQLCSSPIYVLPFYIFSKKESVKHACAAFLMTFSLFGGLATMIYPPQVFIEIIGVNVQTMIHHGLQVVIGVFLACYYRKNLNFKFFLKGIVVYLILFAAAMIMNFTVPHFIDESFNMFYISMYEACTLPLLGDIVYPNVPWIVFLFIYFLGFVLIAFIIFYLEKLFTIRARKANAPVYETTLKEEKPIKPSAKNGSKEKQSDSKTPVIIAKSTSAKSSSTKSGSAKANASKTTTKSSGSKTTKSSGTKSTTSKVTNKTNSSKTSKSTAAKSGAKTSTKKSAETQEK